MCRHTRCVRFELVNALRWKHIGLLSSESYQISKTDQSYNAIPHWCKQRGLTQISATRVSLYSCAHNYKQQTKQTNCLTACRLINYTAVLRRCKNGPEPSSTKGDTEEGE